MGSRLHPLLARGEVSDVLALARLPTTFDPQYVEHVAGEDEVRVALDLAGIDGHEFVLGGARPEDELLACSALPAFADVSHSDFKSRSATEQAARSILRSSLNGIHGCNGGRG